MKKILSTLFVVTAIALAWGSGWAPGPRVPLNGRDLLSTWNSDHVSLVEETADTLTWKASLGGYAGCRFLDADVRDGLYSICYTSYPMVGMVGLLSLDAGRSWARLASLPYEFYDALSILNKYATTEYYHLWTATYDPEYLNLHVLDFVLPGLSSYYEFHNVTIPDTILSMDGDGLEQTSVVLWITSHDSLYYNAFYLDNTPHVVAEGSLVSAAQGAQGADTVSYGAVNKEDSIFVYALTLPSTVDSAYLGVADAGARPSVAALNATACVLWDGVGGICCATTRNRGASWDTLGVVIPTWSYPAAACLPTGPAVAAIENDSLRLALLDWSGNVLVTRDGPPAYPLTAPAVACDGSILSLRVFFAADSSGSPQNIYMWGGCSSLETPTLYLGADSLPIFSVDDGAVRFHLPIIGTSNVNPPSSQRSVEYNSFREDGKLYIPDYASVWYCDGGTTRTRYLPAIERCVNAFGGRQLFVFNSGGGVLTLWAHPDDTADNDPILDKDSIHIAAGKGVILQGLRNGDDPMWLVWR